MSVLYKRLLKLCEEKGITGYRMAKDAGVSVNIMTDLKSGRKKSISAEVANKIADYFGVTVGYLLGEEEKEKPADSRVGELTEEELDYIEWFRQAPENMKEAVRLIIKGDNGKT